MDRAIIEISGSKMGRAIIMMSEGKIEKAIKEMMVK